MEGDCNVYAHSSLWMRPTGEWSINAKMVYIVKKKKKKTQNHTFLACLESDEARQNVFRGQF